MRSLGKTAFISLEHMAKHDVFMTEGLVQNDFNPQYIVAVDTAERHMLGIANTKFTKDCHVVLGIDHHMSNSLYADNTCLDENAAAAAEIVNDILNIMNAEFTKETAESIYVGIATDTGCFRYSNTTAKTLRIAADMIDVGIDATEINKQQFETKSPEYALLEKMAISSMEIHLQGKLAVLAITNDMYLESDVDDSETKPLSALTRQIEGVLVGVTLKEKKKNVFSISIRTNGDVNASALAERFGGGGHKNAAGGTFHGNCEDAVNAVISNTENLLKETGDL